MHGFREAPLKFAYRNVAVSARLIGRPEDTDPCRRKANQQFTCLPPLLHRDI
jgi:hypothetical protein